MPIKTDPKKDISFTILNTPPALLRGAPPLFHSPPGCCTVSPVHKIGRLQFPTPCSRKELNTQQFGKASQIWQRDHEACW
jgi:hypothetical protein